MDPNFYRDYECNIRCPKLSASKKLRADQCEINEAEIDALQVRLLQFSGIYMYSGSFGQSTVHTITPTELPVLANYQCNGELSFYLNNTVYVNVTMAVVVKAGGVILQSLVYQRVGNFTSVELTFSGNTLVLTVSPGATCKWVYRGI